MSSEHVNYNLGAYVNEARYLIANIKDAKPYNLMEKAESALRLVNYIKKEKN